MYNNFHGMVFGYKVNGAVYDEIQNKCSDEEQATISDRTWQIDDNTFIISCDIFIHDIFSDRDSRASYSLTEINQLLAEKKDEIDNFVEYAKKLFSVLDKSIMLLPQLYYINTTV